MRFRLLILATLLAAGCQFLSGLADLEPTTSAATGHGAAATGGAAASGGVAATGASGQGGNAGAAGAPACDGVEDCPKITRECSACVDRTCTSYAQGAPCAAPSEICNAQGACVPTHVFSAKFGDPDRADGLQRVTAVTNRTRGDGRRVSVAGDFTGSMTVETETGTIRLFANGRDIFAIDYGDRWLLDIEDIKNLTDADGDQQLNAADSGDGSEIAGGEFTGALTSNSSSPVASGIDGFAGTLDAFSLIHFTDPVPPNPVGDPDTAQRVIDVDLADGQAFVAGTFDQKVSVPNMTPYYSYEDDDFFVAKIDAQGVLDPRVHYHGPGEQTVTAIAVDSTRGVVVGRHTDAFSFTNGTMFPIPLEPSGPDADGFVIRFDLDDLYPGARFSVSGRGREEVLDVAVLPGFIVLVGSFNQDLQLQGMRLPARNASSSDLFVALVADDGVVVPTYVAAFGDGAEQDNAKLAVHGNGDVYLSGAFEGSLEFGAATLKAPPGQESIFLVKFSVESNQLVPVWSQTFGALGSATVHVIEVVDGQVVIGGEFTGSVDFGGGALVGEDDGFVAAFTP